MDIGDRKRVKVTMREFFAYHIQERFGESPIIVMGGKLFRQFLLNFFTIIESNRLRYISLNQENLRSV